MLGGEVAATATAALASARELLDRADAWRAPRRDLGLIAGRWRPPSLDRAIDDYLTYLRVERGLSPATIRAYRGDLARLRRRSRASRRPGPTARRPPAATSPPGRGAAGPSDPGLAPTSLRRRAASIRGFYRFAYGDGLIARRRRRPHRPAAPAPPAARDADRRRGRGAARGGAGPPRPGAPGAAVRRRAAGQRGAGTRPRGPVARRRLRPGDREGRPRAARPGRRHRARLARPLDRGGPRPAARAVARRAAARADRCSSATAAGGSPGSRPSRSSAARLAGPVSASGSRRTPSATRSRRICSRAAPTCGSSRSCSGMRVSPRPSSTRTSPASGSGRSTPGPIRGPDRRSEQTDGLHRQAPGIRRSSRFGREHQHWFVLIANAVYAIVMWLIAVVLLVLSSTIFNGNSGITSTARLGRRGPRRRRPRLVRLAGAALAERGVRPDHPPRPPDRGRREQDGDRQLAREDQRRDPDRVDVRPDLRLRRPRDPDRVRERDRSASDAPRRAGLQAGDARREARARARAVGRQADAGPACRPPTAPAAGSSIADAPPARAGRGTASRRAAGPPQMSADDVTRTLASLADLRDRGAISAEEYEAKKADLLSRL